MRDRGKRVPPRALPMRDPLGAWRDAVRSGLRATWLGHSTVLLEIDGLRVLTDPVWALRASPVQWAGPKRFHPPPVTLAALPPLDVVLVSHDHYDHLDAAAVRTLHRLQPQARFVTALGVGAHLERFGIDPAVIVELHWGERFELEDKRASIEMFAAQHFSGRGALDRNKTLWGSYVIAGPTHRVFFSGDTGLEPSFAETARKAGPFDLIMLEVGAWHPLWGEIHLGPFQAREAQRQLGDAPLLPIHWSTFDLALHAWDEPMLTLEGFARDEGLPLIAPQIGEAWELGDAPLRAARVRALDPWWRRV
ncbi:MAG: MBL fold metallo-hydrolase [Myxococcales bacterium]|nr:MBL fold metallo-hydrolase [Myxococcales bacterium]